MAHFGDNLRRLMAAKNLTLHEVARRSGLDVRTVHGILNNPRARPHARTLHKLAQGLNVPVEELFQNPAARSAAVLAQQANPPVQQILQNHPELFRDWEQADFHHLLDFSAQRSIQQHAELLRLVESINCLRTRYPEMLNILLSPYGMLFLKVVDAFASLAKEQQGPVKEVNSRK